MIDGKTLWLAANAASGSNSADALAALDDAFAAAGCRVAKTIDVPRDGVPTPEALRAGGVDVLAIFTGDGTVNAVVTGLRGWDGAVLVLPGGTMNILAQRLHGQATPTEIIAKIASGGARRTRPTLVRSRHGDGLSGMLAGPGTAWGDVREALREVDVLGTLASAAEAIGESTGGAKVYCREPACGRPEGYSAIQITPEADGLALHAYYAETLGDYAKQGVALLRRNFREGPHDELGSHPSVRLACSEAGSLGLLIDGEPCPDAADTEEFTLAHCEVDLLATADGA
jgi:hypothetical protein